MKIQALNAILKTKVQRFYHCDPNEEQPSIKKSQWKLKYLTNHNQLKTEWINNQTWWNIAPNQSGAKGHFQA